MLQQEEDNHNLPASGIRVTPQELTKALGAIEAKKEEEARLKEAEQEHLFNTITIGQAINDLCLDSTPEQIWDEVQRGRAVDDLQPQIKKQIHSEVDSKHEYEVEQVQEPSPDLSEAQELEWRQKLRGWQAGNFFDNAHEEPNADQQDIINHQPGWKPKKRYISSAILAIAGIITVTALRQPNERITFNQTFPFVHKTAGSPILQRMREEFEAAAHQTPWQLTDEFYKKLELTKGPSPKYYLVLEGTVYDPMQVPAESFPVNAVPDGYLVYGTESSWRNGGDMMPTAFTFQPGSDWIRREPQYVRYNSEVYRRLWVLQSDTKNILLRQPFKYFDSQYDAGAKPVVPFTVPNRALEDSEITLLYDTPTDGVWNGNCGVFNANKVFEGDEHTWELQPTPGIIAAPLSTMERSFVRSGVDLSSNISTFEDLPDRKAIRIDDVVLQNLCQDLPASPKPPRYQPATIYLDTRPNIHKPWTIIKYDGKLYLRGWVARNLPLNAMKEQYIIIANNPNDPDLRPNCVQITLPMEKCSWSFASLFPFGSAPNAERISASDIHLDKHAWEKW